MRAITLGFITLLFAAAGQAWADDDKRHPAPSTAGPEDHTMERAGMPLNISRLAAPGVGKHEGLGYVGGGRLIHGDGRAAADGTFGFDYIGFGWHPGRLFLGWAHDRKQPSGGPYRTDTFKVPDPISLHPVRKLLHSDE